MEIREFHWLMNIVQNLDVGLVVLDKEYKVQVWNGFMESHSGRLAGEVRDGDTVRVDTAEAGGLSIVPVEHAD